MVSMTAVGSSGRYLRCGQLESPLARFMPCQVSKICRPYATALQHHHHKLTAEVNQQIKEFWGKTERGGGEKMEEMLAFEHATDVRVLWRVKGA